MLKLARALRLCAPREQTTVATPHVPRDCMCQDQSTTPLLPTVRGMEWNERGGRPVE
jgi:hypothetical protein